MSNLTKIINTNRGEDDVKKLTVVNNYFNMFKLIPTGLNNKNSYWTTPEEFIKEGGGRSEDFATAKFFTLLRMGFNEDNLKLLYAKKSDKSHVALIFTEGPHKSPIVLDNSTNIMKSLEERSDLKPVFIFDRKNIWTIKDREKSC